MYHKKFYLKDFTCLILCLFSIAYFLLSTNAVMAFPITYIDGKPFCEVCGKAIYSSKSDSSGEILYKPNTQIQIKLYNKTHPYSKNSGLVFSLVPKKAKNGCHGYAIESNLNLNGTLTVKKSKDLFQNMQFEVVGKKSTQIFDYDFSTGQIKTADKEYLSVPISINLTPSQLVAICLINYY